MKIIKWLDENFEETILVILLILMTVIMGVQVCARYIFGYSLTWSEEVTRYLFIWSSFLSLSYCIKKGISIKLEQVVMLIPKKQQSIVRLLSYSIELIFFIYMIPFAYSYLLATIESGQVSPAVGVPMYVVQVAPLICFILASIRVIQRIIIEFNNFRNSSEVSVKENIKENIKENRKE